MAIDPLAYILEVSMIEQKRPVSFPPEDVDVDWITSETDEYGSWTGRNPL